MVLPAGEGSFPTILLHAVYVVCETALLSWFAYSLKQQDMISAERQSVLTKLMPEDGVIDFSSPVSVKFKENASIHQIYSNFQRCMNDLFNAFKALSNQTSSAVHWLNRAQAHVTTLDTQVKQNETTAVSVSEALTRVVNQAEKNTEEIADMLARLLKQIAHTSQSIDQADEQATSTADQLSEMNSKLSLLDAKSGKSHQMMANQIATYRTAREQASELGENALKFNSSTRSQLADLDKLNDAVGSLIKEFDSVKEKFALFKL